MGTKSKRQTYPVKQVIEMLGMSMEYGYGLVEKGQFPFPILQINSKDRAVPKKPVDDFLEKGILPRRAKKPWKKGQPGRKQLWVPGNFIRWNIPVPVTLNARFDEVLKRMNSNLINPLTKQEALRLAAEEFIQRRPLPICTEDD